MGVEFFGEEKTQNTISALFSVLSLSLARPAPSPPRPARMAVEFYTTSTPSTAVQRTEISRLAQLLDAKKVEYTTVSVCLDARMQAPRRRSG